MERRIVILDPEPVVRDLLVRILERAGYKVETTETLEQAIDNIKRALPDIVLTNVNLRGITGHDAMRQLRGIAPQLPVLMVSGLPDSEVIREWSGESGFDTFPKPFKPQELIKKVGKMLEPSRPQAFQAD